MPGDEEQNGEALLFAVKASDDDDIGARNFASTESRKVGDLAEEFICEVVLGVFKAHVASMQAKSYYCNGKKWLSK